MTDKHSKKITLEQLYQQRKANHLLPEATRQQLLNHFRTKKKPKHVRWQFAVPIAFASVMTIVFIYPNKKTLEPGTVFSDQVNITAEATSIMRSLSAPQPSISADINEVITKKLSEPTQQDPTQSPLTLLVKDGSSGLFENCTGEQVHLELKTNLTGWVVATWTSNHWQIKTLDLKVEPCAVD